MAPTPWMSIELGGLSPTISSVSLRACALASDQMAGAAVAVAPAAAVALKNVRRFIEAPLLFPNLRTPPKARERKERAKDRAQVRDHTVADFTPLLVYNHCMTAFLDLGLHALRSAYCAGTLDVRQTIEEVLKRIAASGDDKVWISQSGRRGASGRRRRSSTHGAARSRGCRSTACRSR